MTTAGNAERRADRRSRRVIGTDRRAAFCSVAAAILVVLCGLVAPAFAQTTEQEQAVMRGIDFEQKLNEQVPLDVRLTDENAQIVTLDHYFGKRPVVLILVYYECPMLCTEVLNGALRVMQEMKLTVGKDFDVVTVSIDPGETPVMAMAKKNQYLKRYDREGAWDSWHFLVGEDAEVRRLADSVGFKYVYDPVTDQYAHASGIVVLTPTGKVSRYFYGVQYNEQDVRLGLVEASSNKIGTPVDKLLLYCYHYDPLSGKYNATVMNIVRLLGVLTVVLLVLGIVVLLVREKSFKSRSDKTGLGAQA